MSTAFWDLRVWQRAMDLAFEAYQSTRDFPREEIYGLTAQMRRAAVSVPSNIAEGRGRFSHKELVHYLLNARGSLLELETQIILANRLAYLSAAQTENLKGIVDETARMLNALMNLFKVA
jgi:four helix bundle protein